MKKLVLISEYDKGVLKGFTKKYPMDEAHAKAQVIKAVQGLTQETGAISEVIDETTTNVFLPLDRKIVIRVVNRF